jgi:hypothetical protein
LPNNLTLPIAINDLLDQVKAGRVTGLDWNSAMSRAADEIHRDNAAAERARTFAPSSELGFLGTYISEIISVAFRGFAGFGLAWLLRRYFPALIPLIT